MATTAVQRLQDAFPDQVTIPGATSYDPQVQTPWSQACWQPAAAYVQLASAADVSRALAIVAETQSRFAVRSTGHNPNPGFSSVGEGGVVLDIRPLQSKSLDYDGRTARCGAGCTWGEVYSWLEEQKRSAIGGRDPNVGLAGFLLGGGYGAFPNLQGVGADSVKNFEIVLASGRIANANTNENPDLFRALKGGAANFGIVTRFDIETYPLIPAQYSITLYKPDGFASIARASARVHEAMERDPKINIFTNFNPGFTAVGLCYAACLAEGEGEPEAFGAFEGLDSVMMEACPRTNGTLLSLARTLGHAQEPQNRYCGTVTTKVSPELYEAAYHIWQDVLKTVPEGAVLHYTLQPAGSPCASAGETRGGNLLGMEAVAQCWWVFTCEWPNGTGEVNAAAREAVHAMVEGVKKTAESRGLLLDYLCANFASSTQNVLGSYGADNVERAKAVAAKYDEDGVFQKLQNGGFLLRDL